jgi:hypothetical protein
VSAFALDLAPRDGAFASLAPFRIPDRDETRGARKDAIVAGQKPHEDVDARLDVPLFPDPSQGLGADGTQPNPFGRPNDDPMLDYILPGSDLVSD